MNWNISIKDYMGRVGDGILTLVTIVNEGVVYDATYWYNAENQVVTIPDELKTILGVADIEDHKEYQQLLLKLKKISVPHGDMINSIDDLDLAKYTPEEILTGEDVDESEITLVATQSDDKNNTHEC